MYARRLIAPDVDVDASSIPRAGQTVGEPEAPHPASDPIKSRRPGPSGGIAARLAASGAEAPPPDPSAEDANTRARDATVGAPPPARVRRHSRAAALKRCDIALPRPGQVAGRAREEKTRCVNFLFARQRIYFSNRLGLARGALARCIWLTTSSGKLRIHLEHAIVEHAPNDWTCMSQMQRTRAVSSRKTSHLTWA